MSIFKNSAVVTNFPSALASKVLELEYEREHSGVHTTPDETANVIEVFFQHLARIWIAELLHLAVRDPNCFEQASEERILRTVYDSTVGGRAPRTIGSWVSIARNIQVFFAQRNLATLTKGLEQVDFGTYGDSEHPVARLIAFRNDFAHGSFQALTENIDEHYFLLAALFERIPGLWEQPLWTAKDGLWYTCKHDAQEDKGALSSDAELPTELESVAANAGQIYVVASPDLGLDGAAAVLALSPLFTCPELEVVEGHFSQITADQLFALEVVSSWQKRYEQERQGYLNRPCSFTSLPSVPENLSTAFGSELEAHRGQLTVVSGNPGCGLQRAAAWLVMEESPVAAAFDSVIYWDVDTGDLTQSGQTLLQKIFRSAEELLGKSTNWGKKRNKLWANFEECTAALTASGKQILLVVQDIHEGQQAYRQESITVLEVFNQLADTNITAVATTHEGVLKNNLFFDHFLNWPVPGELEDADLIAAINRYATTDTHRGVLSVLGEADANGVHLFDICDRLEEKQQEAFEPAVEYALWELRPLLSIQRQRRDIEGKQENARLWSIFSGQLRAHL